MKKLIVLFCLMMATSSAYANQFNTTSNQMMKECLEVWGYNKYAPIEERMSFPFWQEAAACASSGRTHEWQERIAADREFLQTKPWFRGKNWKWQERAEYTCRRITNLSGTFEICSKPYYIN
jgi:hypothetical protein